MFIFYQNFLKLNYQNSKFLTNILFKFIHLKAHFIFIKLILPDLSIYKIYQYFNKNKIESFKVKNLKLESTSVLFNDFKYEFNLFDKFNRTQFPFFYFFLFIYRFLILSYSLILFKKSYNRINYFFDNSLNLFLSV